MLAKLKIGTSGGGLPATEYAQNVPESTGAPFEPLASCARIYQRLDAAEDVHKHIDGPHTPKESRKGWIVTKGGGPFGLPE